MIGGGGLLPVHWNSVTGKGERGGGVLCSRWSAHCSTVCIWDIYAVSEIKVIFGAPTGCTSPKTVRPEISPCTLCI